MSVLTSKVDGAKNASVPRWYPEVELDCSAPLTAQEEAEALFALLCFLLSRLVHLTLAHLSILLNDPMMS